MIKPIDFMIIGGQKCGTTTLYHWLGRHDHVFVPRIKEVHYFADESLFAQGDRYLEPLYRRGSPGQVFGGAYAHLMYFAQGARRMREHNPRMKAIVVLRDPVDRAYSAYWFARSKGWESLPTFEEALEAEEERLQGTLGERTELTYVRHGHYARQLEPYIEALGRDRVHVVTTEALRDSPAAEFARVQEFLELPAVVDLTSYEVKNESGVPKIRWLTKLLLAHDSSFKKAVRSVIPWPLRTRIRESLVIPLTDWNVRARRYPPMNPRTRAWLEDHFHEPNEALRSLLGWTRVPWTRD